MMISEENLKCMPLVDLIDLMVITANELIAMHKKHDYQNRVSKTKELQLIQKIIIYKRVPTYTR